MSDIPEEIKAEINNKYPLSLIPNLSATPQTDKLNAAIFGYHLRDKEVELLKLAVLKSEYKSELERQLQQKDTRIKDLEEQINSLKIIADDE